MSHLESRLKELQSRRDVLTARQKSAINAIFCHDPDMPPSFDTPAGRVLDELMQNWFLGYPDETPENWRAFLRDLLADVLAMVNDDYDFTAAYEFREVCLANC